MQVSGSRDGVELSQFSIISLPFPWWVYSSVEWCSEKWKAAMEAFQFEHHEKRMLLSQLQRKHQKLCVLTQGIPSKPIIFIWILLINLIDQLEPYCFDPPLTFFLYKIIRHDDSFLAHTLRLIFSELKANERG
jgi:hypothetical protein